MRLAPQFCDWRSLVHATDLSPISGAPERRVSAFDPWWKRGRGCRRSRKRMRPKFATGGRDCPAEGRRSASRGCDTTVLITAGCLGRCSRLQCPGHAISSRVSRSPLGNRLSALQVPEQCRQSSLPRTVPAVDHVVPAEVLQACRPRRVPRDPVFPQPVNPSQHLLLP